MASPVELSDLAVGLGYPRKSATRSLVAGNGSSPVEPGQNGDGASGYGIWQYPSFSRQCESGLGER